MVPEISPCPLALSVTHVLMTSRFTSELSACCTHRPALSTHPLGGLTDSSSSVPKAEPLISFSPFPPTLSLPRAPLPPRQYHLCDGSGKTCSRHLDSPGSLPMSNPSVRPVFSTFKICPKLKQLSLSPACPLTHLTHTKSPHLGYCQMFPGSPDNSKHFKMLEDR